ncbi:beta strand repeat-containing protein [Curvibacter sp. APW13]|uniref:beta strand repeat-containing protein n=1 Tax=Curvibacter sp. APW13 TaxID=3077236 RepID=UPI00396579CE
MSTGTQGNQLTVTTQNGAGGNFSAINWQSFSIPQGSSTYFAQPSSSSTVINRVVTNTPSQVFGTLGSNGHLVLINQSGITVGAGAVVDTAGFTASALKMSDADALAGRMRFGDGSSGGNVSVQGQVLARSGDVVLIGSTVDTGQGALIQAPNGSTILAAGNQVEITGRGLEGISMTVQAPDNNAVNLGTLKGDAVGIFAGTLKHSGAIQATRATLEGGKVVLKASGDAMLEGNASITATGTRGGSVDVLGKRVGLIDNTRIDVSGAQGGGQVRIGGDYQGKNTAVPNAEFAYVGKDVSVLANATGNGNGNGGRVIVWADDTTRAYGTIEAKGGAQGGDGGFIETSGKRSLDVEGIRASASAVAGKAGTWLLDPADVSIQGGTGPESMVESAAGSGIWVPNVAASVIRTNTLNSALNSGTNVTVTTYDTTLNPTSLSGGSGNITVQSAISWSGSATLTLDANNDITLSSLGGSISASGGMLKLLAGNRTGANSGTIRQEAGGSNAISVQKLEAVAYQDVELTNTANQVQYVSGKSVAGFFSLFSNSANAVNVASVGGNAGISAQLSVTLKNYGSGGLNVGNNVKATGGVNSSVTLEDAGGSTGGGVTISAGEVSGGSVTISSARIAGSAINQTGGSVKDGGSGTTLNASGNGSISLTGGSNDFSSINFTGAPTSLSITDANNMQLGGLSASGAVTLKAGGNLIVGSISASGYAVSLVGGGSLSQSGASSFAASSVSLTAGTGIGTSASKFNVFSIPVVTASTNTGGVYIQSGAAVTIQGMTANAGDIVVSNSGGITTTGLVSTSNGAVTMTAASPLTVGAGGVSASGNVTLTAASPGDLTLNGPVKSGAGSVSLSATGGALKQNGSVFGATGVSATASSFVYGSAATTSGAPVSYTTTGGLAVTPPIDPIATATSSGALVTTFEETLTAALEGQSTETQLASNEEKKDDPLLSGSATGEICLR